MVTGALMVTPMAYPSRALAMTSVPRLPPAPVRLSATKGWPNTSVKCAATALAAMSGVEPGEKGTITRTWSGRPRDRFPAGHAPRGPTWQPAARARPARGSAAAAPGHLRGARHQTTPSPGVASKLILRILPSCLAMSCVDPSAGATPCPPSPGKRRSGEPLLEGPYLHVAAGPVSRGHHRCSLPRRLAHNEAAAGDASRRLAHVRHRGAAAGDQQVVEATRQQHSEREIA